MHVTDKQIETASSLAEVGELVSVCERCELYKTKTKDVFGVGNEGAEILFIGEAPGKNEDLEGAPFIGAAGKFLNELLGSIGLERADIYIANVLKHRPPNNRDPLPSEAEACWPYLRRQIELINPKLIVFLGRHAMNRFFPGFKISEVHGEVFQSDLWGRKRSFMALYHPTIGRWGGKAQILQEDFAKIPKALKNI